MSPTPKVGVPYERVEVKLPLGLYRKLEELLTVEQTWPSRQDFIIDAVREKLDRIDKPLARPGIAGKR